MPRTTKRTPILDFERAIEKFKQKHRHITFKPPRAKKDRIKNQIKNEHSFLYEYTEIEDRNPIKIEPNEDRKLKNEFSSRFVFEFGEKIGLPFFSDGEMYTEIEDRKPIKIEPNDDSKLKNEFGSRFTFEFGRKLGLPFFADGELYSQINPVGKKYEGIIQNMENGQTQEIDVFILPH